VDATRTPTNLHVQSNVNYDDVTAPGLSLQTNIKCMHLSGDDTYIIDYTIYLVKRT
jgi:hypothetical protein